MGVAGLVILKKRIKSIENTKKLTKAMALVATSKLKKVRVSLYTNDTYFRNYKEVMNEIIPSLPKENRYMQSNGSEKKLIIVITSDMGMCGAYNNNVIDKLEEITKGHEEDYLIAVIGEKGKNLVKRHGLKTLDEYNQTISDVPTSSEAKNIFEYSFNMFRKEKVGEVIILYTWFKNPIVKEPKEYRLLPLAFEESEQDHIGEDEFDIEGNKEELIESIVPAYCNAMILNAMINSKASEQGNRMETMNSATRNADDLIASLRLKYNRVRQGAITQEISEIIGGAQAQS
ncbi:ATP synthase F1 subunit gamma [Clostridium sp.]|uniref:ATP synthase F1 subunit gamma n=1 Tax=Clostridium sp. TaxID=1506 RepID=UPI0032179559